MTGEPRLLDAVEELSRLTGKIALEHFRTGLRERTKFDGTPVTVADLRAERAARDWLEKRFPGDAVLGEEYGEERAGSKRRWLIDPIDGTASFIRSVPLWGTLVAVEEGGTILAGAAYFPAVGELISAALGEGCWLDGVRCSVSPVDTLSAATVLTTDSRFPSDERRRVAWTQLASGASVARTWGDCYGYLMVATGRAEVMVDDHSSPWDTAALYPIIMEAGGSFTDFSSKPTPFGGCAIATNSALAAEVRAILNDR